MDMEKVRKLMDEFLANYIPMQEIIHVCDQLKKSPTEDTMHKMMDYLMQPDKEFIYLQTVNTKAIINNQVRLCMAEIAKLIAEAEEERNNSQPNLPVPPDAENDNDENGENNNNENGEEGGNT